MSLRLLMDEHVDVDITRALQKRGVDATPVQDVNLLASDDEIILEHASTKGLVVFTMDDDFLAIAAKRQRTAIPFSGVIYAKQESMSIGQCIRELEVVAGVYDPHDMVNVVQYLPLK